MFEGVEFVCPNCNHLMIYDEDSMLDVTCPNCGLEGIADTDFPGNVNPLYEFEEDEVWEDPDENMPECCRACGCGAYPNCMTSCKIFDD